MSLLPSTDDATTTQNGEIQVLGLDEDEMGDVFEALSSDTARRLLTAIYEEPATSSELANRLDMSVQNVSYHLDNLYNANVVQVADTRYSKKGTEMDVYAPPDDPVVLFVGTKERKTGFTDVLERLLGAVGLLSLVSVVLYLRRAIGQAGAGGGSDPSTFTAIPGLGFLLGGLFVLLLVSVWWVWTQYRSSVSVSENQF